MLLQKDQKTLFQNNDSVYKPLQNENIYMPYISVSPKAIIKAKKLTNQSRNFIKERKSMPIHSMKSKNIFKLPSLKDLLKKN
jgi:hypothetical protein